MSRSNHPVEQEELMAYLDGELATDRAVEAAAHLERCPQCQELAADLRSLSQEMMAWEAERFESIDIPNSMAAALAKRVGGEKAIAKKTWGILLTPRRMAWGGAVAALLLFAFISVNRLRPDQRMARFYGPESRPSSAPSIQNEDVLTSITQDNRASWVAPPPPPPPSKSFANGTAGKVQQNTDEENGDDAGTPGIPTAPMIARVASLTLATKEFDKTRDALENILKRHGGYMGELKVNAPAEAGRALTATLRVPSPQLEDAMAELKKLGRVENESQGGEEVTQQYVDLQARLANGKHTEQRLTEILRQRTGKLQDVLKVELEIDRVRGEIEQMQAEKKELSKRVAFATLNMSVQEEYHARLQAAPPSTGSLFRNAAVDGYNTVVEGLIAVGLFLLSAGPSLLVWAAILFFPLRWAWKKFSSMRKQESTEEEHAG